MSNLRVAEVVDGICLHWWQVGPVDTSGYRTNFDALCGPEAKAFTVRVVVRDDEPLGPDEQLLLIKPGSDFRLYGPGELAPSVGERVH